MATIVGSPVPSPVEFRHDLISHVEPVALDSDGRCAVNAITYGAVWGTSRQ